MATASAPEGRLPDWTYDELVLAVELYVRRGVPGKADPEIVELPELLQRLPIHMPPSSNPKLRNAAGVYRKLNDIHTSSPEYSGIPTRGNKLDRVVLAHGEEEGARCCVRERSGL